MNGPAVKRAREMAGLTQGELAATLGVDRSTVGHWESTRRPDEPSAPNFKRLCKVLRVKAADLLAVPSDKAA
ncbi:hypothetical protein BJF85_16630 [Saccharomonospora sp. CUA-673]|nr:hypothetical protein BJF85_16630 [Saccharomonospora sp. CUA-673]